MKAHRYAMTSCPANLVKVGVHEHSMSHCMFLLASKLLSWDNDLSTGHVQNALKRLSNLPSFRSITASVGEGRL